MLIQPSSLFTVVTQAQHLKEPTAISSQTQLSASPPISALRDSCEQREAGLAGSIDTMKSANVTNDVDCVPQSAGCSALTGTRLIIHLNKWPLGSPGQRMMHPERNTPALKGLNLEKTHDSGKSSLARTCHIDLPDCPGSRGHMDL